MEFSLKFLVTEVPDAGALSVTDLHFLHEIFTQNTEKIVSTFQSQETAQKLHKLLEKLGSYQSKISFSFLTNNDRSKLTYPRNTPD